MAALGGLLFGVDTFFAFWSRFAPGGAVAGLASARVGVALAKPPAMPKRS